ncbi:hypothetical protein FEDK69T_11890 [Flavobacterium enshiense DK69]|uniref:Uncharacterized protein n=1 Tax=Flavobacterium enshiense DK69 TaxID=1107311 RepID=V6SAY7_9FLAO|nr:hypothetical protein [Flavobacterium enshiense]ESU23781.1 hypothetical protein FEDK69T_11890 [Flavobacterium enshiense DK69]KGO96091.1 hypothetical protein Q767_07465 [Flavobacterium enshiense DK69]
MKFLIYIAAVFFSLITQELTEVRESYYAASKSKQNAEKFHAMLSGYNKNNATLLAYKGAAIVLKSKYVPKAKQKKELFVEGVTIVEKALKSEPANAEIHLIRLSIQENTPKALKYKGNIEEDKKLIVNSFDNQSKEVKECIKKYVKQSAVFSEHEKKQILK